MIDRLLWKFSSGKNFQLAINYYGNSLEVIGGGSSGDDGGGGGLITILRGFLAPMTPTEQLSNGISPPLWSKSADSEQYGIIFPGL